MWTGRDNIVKLPVEIIHEVETEYDVASVTVNGVQIWPFLRQVFFSHYIRRVMPGMTFLGTNTPIVRELGRIRNAFCGRGEWFRKHRYPLLSSTALRREVGGRYVDKNAEWLMQDLGKKDVLMIEMAQDRGGWSFQVSRRSGDNTLSFDPLAFLAVVPVGKRSAIANEGVLRAISDRYGLNVDYVRLTSTVFRAKGMFRFLMRRWGTEGLFLSTNYYGLLNLAAIAAARETGIPSAEIQHGVVTRTHEAYNVFCPLAPYTYPDYFLCHGEQARATSGPGNHFLHPEQVLVVGCGYIVYVRDHCSCDVALAATLAKHDRSVTVSSAETVDDDVIEFVRAAAMLDARIRYVSVPRRWTRDHAALGLPPKVVFFPDLDFYRIVKFTDLHATVASTCAVEAPAFGTPNILMNVRGLAKSFYRDVLTDDRVTRYADSPDEFVGIAQEWMHGTRAEVVAWHRGFILDGHRDALGKALHVVLGGAEGTRPRNGVGDGMARQNCHTGRAA